MALQIQHLILRVRTHYRDGTPIPSIEAVRVGLGIEQPVGLMTVRDEYHLMQSFAAHGLKVVEQMVKDYCATPHYDHDKATLIALARPHPLASHSVQWMRHTDYLDELERLRAGTAAPVRLGAAEMRRSNRG